MFVSGAPAASEGVITSNYQARLASKWMVGEPAVCVSRGKDAFRGTKRFRPNDRETVESGGRLKDEFVCVCLPQWEANQGN